MASIGKRIYYSMFSLYPPYLGAGVRVKIARDVKSVDVTLKQHFWNRNYVNTHFGGSIYSMCDPFFFFLLIENLGMDYIIWDKSASIKFVKPGRGTLQAHFEIPEAEYKKIRKELKPGEKFTPHFTVDVTDEQGDVVATVEKVIYVKRKRDKK